MRRREFISIVGAAVGWVLPARAQQPAANMPVVTLINARGADGATVLTAEFRKGLSQTGLTEGKDVAVEYHWLDGHYENSGNPRRCYQASCRGDRNACQYSRLPRRQSGHRRLADPSGSR